MNMEYHCPHCKTALSLLRCGPSLSTGEHFYRARCPGCGWISMAWGISPNDLLWFLGKRGVGTGWTGTHRQEGTKHMTEEARQ